jgi:hypothetical protein
MSGGGAASGSLAADRRIAPHNLLFPLYATIYFFPLWLVGRSGFGAGMLGQTGADANALMGRIAALYAAGTASFLLGSGSASFVAWMLGAARSRTPRLALVRIYQVDKIVLAFLVCAFLASKLLLVPLGVYSAYAFDTNMMDSPVWSASMFFSEMLVFASLLALFSGLRHNVLVFCGLTLLSGVNLLHGTRNFFVTAMIAAMLYGYLRKRMSLPKMAAYGAGAFCFAVFLAYLVYLNRQHAAFSDFSLISILSPITFESVFAQISLVNVLSHPSMVDALGHPLRFLGDVLIFASPRALIGDKEELLWAHQFAPLSPLGGFSGFAMGLLYFGYLLPAAYFLLGLAAGMLRRLSNTSAGAAMYVYFCCDFLYRIQRDGYVIPAKMCLDNMIVLGLLGCLHASRRRAASRPRAAAGAGLA